LGPTIVRNFTLIPSGEEPKYDSEQLRTGTITAKDLMLQADANWSLIQQKPQMIMEEQENNGQWVRQWLRSLVEFPDFKQRRWADPVRFPRARAGDQCGFGAF
jgi:hypothetical protein